MARRGVRLRTGMLLDEEDPGDFARWKADTRKKGTNAFVLGVILLIALIGFPVLMALDVPAPLNWFLLGVGIVIPVVLFIIGGMLLVILAKAAPWKLCDNGIVIVAPLFGSETLIPYKNLVDIRKMPHYIGGTGALVITDATGRGISLLSDNRKTRRRVALIRGKMK